MADVTYSVEVQYLTSGSLVSMNAMRGVKEAEQAAKKMRAEAKHFGDSLASHIKTAAGSFNHAFDSIAMSLASGVGTVAMGIGATLSAGFGLGLREMMKFNEEMENLKVSVAAVSVATGESSSMSNGLRIAGSILKEMRKDAQALPGSIEDLQKIYSFIRPALPNSVGAEKIAANLMVAGKMEGIKDVSVMGREYAAMIEGSARTSMPLFRKLMPLMEEFGVTSAKTYNAKGEDERIRITNAALQKLSKPAMEVLPNTWNTIKETAIDNVRLAMGAVGGNLFEHIKDKVAAFNDIKSGGRGLAVLERWGKFGEDVSDHLVKGFEKAFQIGSDFIHSDWIPLIRNFTQDLWWGIHGALKHFESFFGGAGRLKKFLGDPLAFEKLAHLASVLGALRVGTGVLGASAPMLPGLISAFGGGSGGAMALAGAALPAIGVIAALALAADGAVHAITDTQSAFHSVARYLSIDFGNHLTATAHNLEQIWENIEPLRDALGTVLLGGLDLFGKYLESLSGTIQLFTSATRGAYDWIREHMPGGKDPKLGNLDEDVQAAFDEVHAKRTAEYMMPKVMTAEALAEIEKNSKPPNHTTHIHNVNISVNSNQDPNRIARRTASIMMDYARNPRSATNSGNPVLTRSL